MIASIKSRRLKIMSSVERFALQTRSSSCSTVRFILMSRMTYPSPGLFNEVLALHIRQRPIRTSTVYVIIKKHNSLLDHPWQNFHWDNFVFTFPKLYCSLRNRNIMYLAHELCKYLIHDIKLVFNSVAYFIINDRPILRAF